jgi:hypothetical protein
LADKLRKQMALKERLDLIGGLVRRKKETMVCFPLSHAGDKELLSC